MLSNLLHQVIDVKAGKVLLAQERCLLLGPSIEIRAFSYVVMVDLPWHKRAKIHDFGKEYTITGINPFKTWGSQLPNNLSMAVASIQTVDFSITPNLFLT